MSRLSNASGIRYRSYATALFAIVVSLLVVIPAAPAAAADGLTIRADTLYDIQTEEGLVAVTSDITVTNVTPNKRSGNTITRFYYYAFSLPIPVEAENVAATSGSRDLKVEVTEGESGFFNIAEISLRSRLFYKQSHSIQLSFDFVGADPRSEESEVRVNDAFVWFFAWAFGDADRATVRIVAPLWLDASLAGSTMSQQSVESDSRVWVAEDIPDPDDWFVTFTGFGDDRLAKHDIEVDGSEIELRYWPGDLEWRDDVAATARAAIPALIDVLGLEWPVEEALVIRETVLPNFFGYGGWYYTEDDIIEMGEYADNELIVHELSHAYFHEELFPERWIAEGLAQAVTEEILRESFDEDVSPDRVLIGDTDFRLLNSWSYIPGGTGGDDDVEAVGYNTSWYVVSEIIDEIGLEGLQEVLAAALENEIAYLGAGDPEVVDETDDWKRFLDLVEERGGATEATELFMKYVVRPGQTALMEQRGPVRAAYAELTAELRDWAPPIIVREPMEQWEFSAAEEVIGEAQALLQAVSALDAHASGMGLTRPATIEPHYENVQWSFVGANHLVDEQEATLDAIEAAEAAVSAPRDEATVLGLEERDPDAELVAARAAFEANELRQARIHAAVATAMLDGAADRGSRQLAEADIQQQVMVAAPTALLLWLLGLFLVGRSRRRRRAAGVVARATEVLDTTVVYGPPVPPDLLEVEQDGIDSGLPPSRGADDPGATAPDF